MLSVRNVRLTLGSSIILNNISFTLQDGEKVGLVGDNGAGKTTLLRVIVGEIEPNHGTVVFSGNSRKRICYIPQHIPISKDGEAQSVLVYMMAGRDLLRISARITELELEMANGKCEDQVLSEYLALVDQFQALEGYQAEDNILNILIGVGLNEIDLDQPVRTLSGGQKSRLALGRMLFEQSDVLILDEPTNHIDAEAYLWLSRYLANCQQSVILVSHYPAILDAVASRILYLDRSDRQLRSYVGNYSHFLQQRDAGKIRVEREYHMLSERAERMESFIRNATQSKMGLKHAREKALDKLRATIPAIVREKRVRIMFPVHSPIRSTGIEASAICKSFGDRTVLSGASITLGAGERVLLQGKNGAGKTTFMRILAGELNPSTGNVFRSARLKLGWYRQEQEDLQDQLSVIEEARLSAPEAATQFLRSALAHFLFFSDKIDQLVGTLSRGERARLALCKIMLAGPNCLLLDEPTNHLDQSSRAVLAEALADYSGAMIVISHDNDFADSLNISRVLVLQGGKVSDAKGVPTGQ